MSITSLTIEPIGATPQALPMGSYRHDIAYTGALKSFQVQALGSYRHDIAYTGALKSAQQHALGNYRHDVSYTAALKSAPVCMITIEFQKTGVKRLLLAPVLFRNHEKSSAVLSQTASYTPSTTMTEARAA